MLPWMNWMGLLISWAMPATSRPSEACFSVWTSCICFSERLVSASSSCRSRVRSPRTMVLVMAIEALMVTSSERASTARNGVWRPGHGRDAGEGVAGQDTAPLQHHQREEQPEGASADRPRRAPREEHHPGVCVDEVEADERARAAPHEVEEHGEGDEVEADLQARLEAAAGRARAQPPLVAVVRGEEDVVGGDDHRHGQGLADGQLDPEDVDREDHGEHQAADEEPAHADEPAQQPPELGHARRLGPGRSPVGRRLGRPEHDGAGADPPLRFTLQRSQQAAHRGAIVSHPGVWSFL